MKFCIACKQNLELENFRSSSRTADGLQTKCKNCAKEAAFRSKELYHSNTEYRNKKNVASLKKYHSDPAFKEKLNKQRTENQKKQYHSDPAFKEKLNKQRSINLLKQYHNDPKIKVHINISSQIRSSLKDGKQGQSWESILGYTLADLMTHLELLFEEGMNWDNYGEWHIDHRMPKSWFNFETVYDVEFKKCWDINNLKPMWGSENIAKGNKFSD
jgi:hypothetical protein